MNRDIPSRSSPAKEERFERFFEASRRERAAFEAGIKLGGIFHQFLGTPLSLSNKRALEKAIEESVRIQPYVHSVHVEIRKQGLHEKREEFDYATLRGEDLYVELVLRYKEVELLAVMEYLENEEYPLMFIKKIKEI